MAIEYPDGLDDFTNPGPDDQTEDVSHSQQHSDANDAIEALEAKLGINSSTDEASLDYKVSQIEGQAGNGNAKIVGGKLYLKYVDGWHEVIPVIVDGFPDIQIQETPEP